MDWSQLSNVAISEVIMLKIMWSMLLVFLVWVINKLINSTMHRNIEDVRVYYRMRKKVQYVTVSIGTLLMVGIWADSLGSISTFLGLVSAGFAIALKDLIINIAAWTFIIFRKPFEVGDRIEIQGISGDVIDLRLFQFTLMETGNWVEGDQSTGRVIHVPNSVVLSDPMANYSKGFKYIWNEVSVVLTFESDWTHAKKEFLSIANKHSEHLQAEAEQRIKEASRKYMIFYSKLTPIVYTSVVDHGVQLTLRYLCEPKRRRTTTEHIWEDALRLIEGNDNLELAYPTQRLVVKENMMNQVSGFDLK